MAHYKKFEDNEKIYVEQNIFNDAELESYEPKMDMLGKIKTAVLYCYKDKDEDRFYLLGLLENININDNNINIVSKNLSNILKYKTANTRRKYIYQLIRDDIQLTKNF